MEGQRSTKIKARRVKTTMWLKSTEEFSTIICINISEKTENSMKEFKRCLIVFNFRWRQRKKKLTWWICSIPTTWICFLTIVMKRLALKIWRYSNKSWRKTWEKKYLLVLNWLRKISWCTWTLSKCRNWEPETKN